MGPVFYLVQPTGVLRPISAVLLGNWPHGFALAHGGRLCRSDMGVTRVWGPIRAPAWLLLTSSPTQQVWGLLLRGRRQVVRSGRPGLARFAGAGALRRQAAGRKLARFPER